MRIVVYLLALVISTSHLFSINSTWIKNSSGQWLQFAEGGNWTTPLPPSNVDDIANLTNAIISNSSVILNIQPTLGRLVIDNTNNYTLVPFLSGEQMTFEVSALPQAELQVNNTNGNGAHSITHGVILNDALTINVDSTASVGLEISGVISGSNGITYTGPQTLRFSAANTYTGNTTVEDGTFDYNANGAIPAGTTLFLGDGVGAANTAIANILQSVGGSNAFFLDMKSDGRLNQATFNKLVRLTGLSGTGGNINLGNNGFDIFGTGGDTTFAGNFIGGNSSASFDPSAGSRMNRASGAKITLTGNSTTVTRYFISSGGTINAQSNGALGASGANSGTFVRDGGMLEIEGGVTLAKRILLNGTGISSLGAIRNVSGANTISNSDTVDIGWSGGAESATDPTISIEAGSLTIDAIVQGTNNLTKTGTGTLTYGGNGANTHSGTTTINQGTLSLNKTGVDAIVGNLFINTNGTVQNNQTNQISTSSTVQIDGGTYDLNGNAESIGNLVFNSGTLTQGGATLTLTSTSTALSMRGNTTLSDPIALSGALGGTIAFDNTNNGTAQIGGNIDLGAQTRIFNIAKGSSSTDMSVGGIISNGGLDKQGAGKLTLTGSNTYSGPTNVTGGILSINGALFNTTVTVAPGATLQGTGAIGVGLASVSNSGEVNPGDSIGTLTINGSYTQNAGGTLTTEVLDKNNFDQLIVITGGVNLAGTLNLEFLPNHSVSENDLLTIIDNTLGTGVVGTFDAVTESNLSQMYQSILTYNSDSVVLGFEKVTPLLDGYPISSQVIFSLINRPIIIIDRHLERVRQNMRCINAEGNSSSIDECAISTPDKFEKSSLLVQRDPSPNNWQKKEQSSPIYRIYFAPIGSVGTTKQHLDQDGLDNWNIGAIAGFDASYDYSAWGLVAAYEKLDAKVKNNWGRFDIHSLSLNGYGTWSPESHKYFFLEGLAGLGYQWQYIYRNGLVSQTKSTPDGFSGNAAFNTGYTIVRNRLTWVPRVGLEYMGYQVNSYSENGGDTENLSFQKQNANSLRPTLALAVLGNEDSSKSLQLLPEVRLRYQREVLDPDNTLTYTGARLTTSPSIKVIGGGRDYVYIGGSLRVQPKGRFSADASYDFEWNQRFHSHYFYVGMNYRF